MGSWRERAGFRLRNYHCRGCDGYYRRRLRFCPDCRTRKGEYGYGIGRIKLM
jgi:hypothetical protein